MRDYLTKDDIKKSVEYRWRMGKIKTLLVFMFACLFISLIFGTIIYFSVNATDMGFMCLFPFIILLTYLVVTGPYMIYCLLKIQRLLSHYNDFQMYEVKLENKQSDQMFSKILSYKVSIFVKYRNIDVDTNPIFSDSILSQFTLKDYDKKNVFILYDDKKNKAYVMCRS